MIRQVTCHIRKLVSKGECIVSKWGSQRRLSNWDPGATGMNPMLKLSRRIQIYDTSYYTECLDQEKMCLEIAGRYVS